MKKYICVLLALVFATSFATPVLGGVPYQSYNFNAWGGMTPAPLSYVPLRSFTLDDIDPTLGDMNDPTDLHVDHFGNIFLTDHMNSRIIVFDRDLNLNRVLTGFYRNGVHDAFNRPTGVFVTPDNEIFITDTHNHRIVVIDENDNFIREILSPQIEGLEDDFVFLPLHVVVDRGGRVFTIVQRVFEGIMSFNNQGEFIGYFGTIGVGFNPIEVFWRMFMTQEQRASQLLFIPTEFQGMDIDPYGFIFTTNIENWAGNNQVMRLNPRGEDVLLNFNENVIINGDQFFRSGGALSGMSVFIDVVAHTHGMYSALCSTRGRVFTYDQEGNVLHVIGGTGTVEGMFRRPVSIELLGDDMLVLDAHGRGRITQFTPTEHGNLINTAIRARYDGDEETAVAAWRRLVEIDENFALAWSGIGRTMLAQGDNISAMYYLHRGMDIRYYSVAFRRNRLDRMQVVLPNMLTGGFVLLGVIVVAKTVMRYKKKGEAL